MDGKISDKHIAYNSSSRGNKQSNTPSMMEKRRTRTRPCRYRFSAVLWFAFLCISIGSMIIVGRQTSRVMLEIIGTDQTAIDLPRQLTLQTIDVTSSTPNQNHSSSEKEEENQEDATKSSFEKYLSKAQTIRMSSSIQHKDRSTRVNDGEYQQDQNPAKIEVSLEDKLPEQTHAEEDVQDQKFRYKLGLVRILGNPIPPKHNKNQSLRNLEFLLENEPRFDTTVDKHWILNRIADDEYQQEITRILRSHNQTFSVLPFEIKEYNSKPYRYAEASRKLLGEGWKDREVDLLRNRTFWKGDEDSKNEMNRNRKYYIDELYKEKYLYVTNQNNARNSALELYHGNTKKKSKFEIDYVLPWDGDCFLSQSAHDSLHRDLERHNDEQQQRISDARKMFTREMRGDDDVPDSIDINDDFIDFEIGSLMETDSLKKLIKSPIKYFYTPVEKFGESEEESKFNRLEKESKPMKNEEELQLILHRTAKARFDGRSRSQVWMLKKLKIKGVWDDTNPFRPTQKDYNFHQFSVLSASGEDSNEGGNDFENVFSSFENGDSGSPAVGWVTRLDPGESSLSQRESITLLARNLDTRAVNQIHYKRDNSNDELEWNNSPYLFYNEKILEREARESKKTEDPSSLNRLIQQLTNVADSLKGDRTYFESSLHVQFPVAEFLSESTILGLAYELTGDVDYAKHAADNIRSYFLNSQTRLPDEIDTFETAYQSGSGGSEERSLLHLSFESLGDSNSVDEDGKENRPPRLNILDFNSATEFLQHAPNIESSVEFTTSYFNDLYFFLDAVKMVAKSGELSESEIEVVRDFFRHYLEDLVNSGKDFGNAAHYENDHHGLYFDIQVISVAAFTGNQSLAVRIAHESVSRLIGQAHKFERAVEKGNKECSNDLLFTLQGWMTLARIASNYLGIDLWQELPLKRPLNDNPQSKKTKKQPFLCRAGEYAVILSTMNSNFCSESESTEWSPIHWTVQQWDCPAPWKFTENGLDHYTEQPIFPAFSFGDYHTHGIAPFWNLGLA